MLSKSLVLAITAFTSSTLAAQAAYAQCGGQGWTGGTACVSGYTCTPSNAYYSQCLPAAANQATTVKTTAKTSSAAAAPKSTTPATSNPTYKASFTQYGSGDTFGSGNCNVASTACGFYTSVSILSIPFLRTSKH